MRDEAALAAVAEFLAALRKLFPARCYADRRTSRPGQMWIVDQTGRPPYTTAFVRVRRVRGSILLSTIRILDAETIRVSLPYSDCEMVRSMTADRAILSGKRVALDKLNASGARRAARTIRDLVDLGLVTLPPIAEADELSAWRIV